MPIVRMWQIRTPRVYRYLDKQYVDEFFNSGRLRLGTFRSFAQHPNEMQRDAEEGKAFPVAYGQDCTIVAMTQHGQSALILSTSTLLDRSLSKTFEKDHVFCINNTLGFAAAIATHVSGFVDGFEGFCIYSDDRILPRQSPEVSIESLKAAGDNSSFDLDKASAAVFAAGGPEVFFVKRRKYQHESEYRFVWRVGRETDDAVFIDCPDAIQFCERVESMS